MKYALTKILFLIVLCVHCNAADLLTASGSIASVDRRHGRVFLAASKPFWAPSPSGGMNISLWPTSVLLTVAMSGTGITIDGKKGNFDQLAEGQLATIQYFMSWSDVGMYAYSLHCVAFRMDVRTASPKPARKEKEKPKSH
jgi:hypothetical protein